MRRYKKNSSDLILQTVLVNETLPDSLELSAGQLPKQRTHNRLLARFICWNEKEIEIIQRIADFPSVVSEAGRTYSPALIANYVFELAKGYNQFYHDYSILKEENGVARAFRLHLSRTVADIIRRGFSLLGVEVPERM